MAQMILIHYMSTVSKTVFSTLKKILTKASQRIVFLHTREQLLRAKYAWANEIGFLCTIALWDAGWRKIETTWLQFG